MMFAASQHVIESGDQPNEDLATCKATGCGFSVRSKDRNVRMAACYRHLADVIEESVQGNDGSN